MDRRLAIVPTLWNNDDIPELTQPETPYEDVLASVAEIGFRGIEFGSNFPTTPSILGAALRATGLTLTAAYYARDFTQLPARQQDIEDGVHLARVLSELGTSILVVADVLRPQRSPYAGTAGPEHAASVTDFARIVGGFHDLARRLKPLGIICAFHNHAGTFLETEDEIERFLRATDPSLVKFCLDTGHATLGRADPIGLIRRHAHRLVHVHLKDVDAAAFSELRSKRYGFFTALRSQVFCELGRGCVPIDAIVSELRSVNYGGWYTVEQDTTRRSAAESARASYEYLAALVPRTSDGRGEKRPLRTKVRRVKPRKKPALARRLRRGARIGAAVRKPKTRGRTKRER
jgi:inosose dehydratase